MFVESGGVRCFAEVVGPADGPAIVCIHGGFGLDHSYFWPALRPLAATHRLVLPDLRGHGRSDPLPAEGFRMEDVIQDLEALREAVGLEQWCVLGHSGGGFVATAYAGTHPDRVRALLLVCAFPRYPFFAAEWLRRAKDLGDPEIEEGLAMFLRGVRTDAEYRAASLKIAPLFFADPRAVYRRAFARIIHRVAPYRDALARYSGVDWGPRAAPYRGRALLLHGDRDPRVPMREGKKWLRFLPQAEWMALPGVGHFPFLEQPEGFCTAVTSWLTRT